MASLETVPAQLAAAVPTVSYATQSPRRFQLQAVLYDAALQLVGQTDVPLMLDFILQTAASLTGTENGFVFMWDPAAAALCLQAGLGALNEDLGRRHDPQTGLIGAVWSKRQLIVANNYPHAPFSLDQYHRFQSVMAAPIQLPAGPVGLLGLARERGQPPFAQDDVWLLERLVELAAAAVGHDQSLAPGEPAGQTRLAEMTARRRVDNERRRSERRYRALIDGLPDLLFRVDGAGVFLDYFTPSGADAMPIPPALFLGRSLIDVFPPAIASQALIAVKCAATTGEVGRIEYQLSAGASNWQYEARFIATDPDEVVIIIRDITEAKQAAAVLARRLRELTVLVDVAQAIASTLDLNEMLARIAARVLDLMDGGGFTISHWQPAADTIATWLEVRRRQPQLADAPGTVYALADFPAARQVLQTRQPLVIQASDRHYFPRETTHMAAQQTATLLLLPLTMGADVIGLVEIDDDQPRRFQDADIQLCQTIVDQAAIAIHNARLYEQVQTELRERQRAEASLHESEARLAQFSDALTVGMLVVGRDGRVAYANEHARALLGQTAWQGLSAKDMCVLLDARVRGQDTPYPEAALPLVRALSGEVSVIDDLTIEHDGRRIPLEIRGTPIFDTAGEVVYAVSAIQSIEARLRTQAALILARDQALAASRLKSELLARVSHELRTPLNAIMGYGEMLVEGIFGAVTPEQKEALAEMIDSASYLTGLVDRLLDQAQLEARRIHLRREPVAVRPLLKTVISRLSVIARSKGLSLQVDIASDVPAYLLGDDARLQQILVNLINNAIKFTPAGSVTVRVRRPDYYRIAFVVQDTGIGIPEAARQLIFEPFSQVDGSHTRTHDGAGLGLSIVQQLVHFMEGEIDVVSVEGEGSTFTVFLPLDEASEVALGG